MELRASVAVELNTTFDEYRFIMSTFDCLRYLAACFYIFGDFAAYHRLSSWAYAWNATSAFRVGQDEAVDALRSIVAKFGTYSAEGGRSAVSERSADLYRRALRVVEEACKPIDNEYRLTEEETVLWRDWSVAGNNSRVASRAAARRARQGRGLDAINIIAADGDILDYLAFAHEQTCCLQSVASHLRTRVKCHNMRQGGTERRG